MNAGEALSDSDQTDTDLDGLGDICDLDKDGDTIPNDKDPSELENTVSYHFDSFLLQQSSEAGSFKLATIGESVLRDTNEVVVSASANQLDLGSDSVNDNTFIVSSEYQTAEKLSPFGRCRVWHSRGNGGSAASCSPGAGEYRYNY